MLLKKKLNKIDILGLVIGAVIGWGSFTLPGKKFLQESGVINTTIGLVIGGLLIFVIQHVYHVMLTHHNDDGGEFTFTYKILGKKHGFVVGWSLVLCYLSMIPLNASAIVLLIKTIFKDKVEWGYLYTIAGSQVYLSDILIVVIVIFLFYMINKRGIVFSSFIQNVMSISLVGIVTLLLIAMFQKSDLVQFNMNYIQDHKISLSEISSVIAIVPFLFVGFDVVPQVVSDLKFKSSKATMVTLVAIAMGVFVYAALNLIAALSFNPQLATQSSFAVADSIIYRLGNFGFYSMLIALFAAIVGGINGFMIASSRMVVALAKYKILPIYFEDKVKNVPVNALKFVCIISVLAPLLGRNVILYIVDVSSLLAAIVYLYVGLISLRFVKTFFSKLLAYIAIVISILFIALLVVPYSAGQLSIVSFILVLVWGMIGVIFYMKKGGKS